MAAVLKDLYVDQGSDFIETFYLEVLSNPSLPYDCSSNPYVAKDLTGYTAEMVVKSSPDSNIDIINYSNLYGLVLGGIFGSITLTIAAADTASIIFAGFEFDGYYDMEIMLGNQTTRILQGKFVVSRDLHD